MYPVNEMVPRADYEESGSPALCKYNSNICYQTLTLGIAMYRLMFPDTDISHVRCGQEGGCGRRVRQTGDRCGCGALGLTDSDNLPLRPPSSRDRQTCRTISGMNKQWLPRACDRFSSR